MLFGLQYLGCRQYGLSLFRLLSPEYIPAASYRSLSLACLRNSWARDIICRRNISLREARHARRQLLEIFIQQIFETGQYIPVAFAARDKLAFVETHAVTEQQFDISGNQFLLCLSMPCSSSFRMMFRQSNMIVCSSSDTCNASLTSYEKNV